jgi:HlyD family secretion protein
VTEFNAPISARAGRTHTGVFSGVPLWMLIAGGAVLLLLGVGGWWYKAHGGSESNSPLNGTFYSVIPVDLDVKIAKDGELAAISNIDVQCHVEGQNTITYVIPEGSNVQKGDVLVTLDSSAIKHKVDDLKASLDTAQANLVTAQQMEEIQKSQNAANLDAAQVSLELAKLDLEAYEQGMYPQALLDAQTQLKMAEQTLANKQDDQNNTMTLFGKGFVTPSDVKKAELDVTTAVNARDKAKTALEVLEKFTHKKDLTNNQSLVIQAQQKLEHTRAENAANLTQREAVVRAAATQVRIYQTQYDEQREQLENCTIKAPAAGFVIYASSLDRNSERPIQEGATVRDKQLLIRLPDTSGMKAIVRIPEAQRTRIRMDEKNPQRAIVRIMRGTKPLEVTAWVSRISPIADLSQRWYNPDLKEYPVDLTLDWVPEDLKPSETVKAEIFCEHIASAIAVPMDCIYSAGNDNFVFERQDDVVKPVMVTIGQSTETYAQVSSGLTSGAEVLRLQVGQGRMLLERNGIKVAPSTRPSGRIASGKSKPGSAAPAAPAKSQPPAEAKQQGKSQPPQTEAEAQKVGEPSSPSSPGKVRAAADGAGQGQPQQLQQRTAQVN